MIDPISPIMTELKQREGKRSSQKNYKISPRQRKFIQELK